MNTNFDVIVIGVGSMGSSACYYLAKRGCTVLGIDQFNSPHEYGSHAGQSRIIRKAYFEDPGYVPLLERAYHNWKELEQITGTQLYHRTGLVYFGSSHSPIISGVKRSAQLHSIPVEQLHGSAITERFPQFAMPENFEALFEPDAGFITPENAIRLYKEQAEHLGANIHSDEKVVSWTRQGKDIIVSTDKGDYSCGKLVFTAGAWAAKMIPVLANAISITRQFVAWVQPGSEKDFSMNAFPCWMIADNQRPGAYYGFPWLSKDEFGPPGGLKLAHHYPGNITDPDNVTRDMIDGDMENILYALNKYLPAVGEVRVVSAKVCLYANSPDENFIIDHLAGQESNVIIACGFSGHGFKFASVVGEILAELAIEAKTSQPIEFLSARRFVC